MIRSQKKCQQCDQSSQETIQNAKITFKKKCIKKYFYKLLTFRSKNVAYDTKRAYIYNMYGNNARGFALTKPERIFFDPLNK